MRWCRKRAPEVAPERPAPPDPEHAWKALALVNDWLKHAETKLGVTLAAAGVSGGVLFNLVKDRNATTCLLDVTAVVCGIAVLTAGAFAMIGLFPILRLGRQVKDETANPLFFHDIARAYKGDGPSYSAVLHTLTTSPDDLVRHIGRQVHANATVAQRKYRWANWAIRALLIDLIALGATAAIIAMKW